MSIRKLLVGIVCILVLGVSLTSAVGSLPAIQKEKIQDASSSSASSSVENQSVKIVTTSYGTTRLNKTTTIRVNPKKAEWIRKKLNNLIAAIKTANEASALQVASQLQEKGVFSTDKIVELIRHRGEPEKILSGKNREALTTMLSNEEDAESEIINLLSFVVGNGSEGFLFYPLDAALFLTLLFILQPDNPLGVAIILMLSAGITHAIPFRVLLPAMAIYYSSGQITTTGLKGTRLFPREKQGVLFGFIGLSVNIIYYTQSGIKSDFFLFGFTPAICKMNIIES